MTLAQFKFAISLSLVAIALGFCWMTLTESSIPDDRKEVVFWHFWGGQDRDVVDEVVRRFNNSQQNYFVRAVAMPGNNLQAKLFLSVTGGDPPDLINQDDPILADWSSRGVVQSFETIASQQEIKRLEEWMFPSALRLSQFDNELFAVCNGLDIRALYYNKSLLDRHDFRAPQTLAELNEICKTISPASHQQRDFYTYLPDSRRLWAWGFVFGNQFYDDGQAQINTPELNAALEWMTGFSAKYGADNIAAFRQGDQSLPGKAFPLLPVNDDELVGRYGMIMDGQWRTRDIAEFNARRTELGIESPAFGVCPLPYPDGGKSNAGWVNGNFFVVPKGARCSAGAWEFVKFWIGLDDPGSAALTCAAGGWIPVSQTVVKHPDFQSFLEDDPLFKTFVELASSPNQFPIPMVQGAPFFKRTVESAAYEAMIHPEKPTDQTLANAEALIQQHLDRKLGVGPKR